MEAFKSFVFEEWYFAIPMFLMSLIAMTLVIWRFLLNASAKTDMGLFLPEFQKRFEKQGAEAALKFARNEQGFIANKLFPAGLEVAPQGIAAMKRSMASVIELEILPQLNFLLAPILALAKIATMVGLLGTVVSMINTFNKIKEADNVAGVSAQAGAIGLALFATAIGLMTAIPLVFCHVMFKDWIARYETQMKSSAQKLILMVQKTRPGNPPAATSKATLPAVESAEIAPPPARR